MLSSCMARFFCRVSVLIRVFPSILKYNQAQDLGNYVSLTLEGCRLSKPKLVSWAPCRVRRKRMEHHKVFLLCSFNHLSETALGCLHLSMREPKILSLSLDRQNLDHYLGELNHLQVHNLWPCFQTLSDVKQELDMANS